VQASCAQPPLGRAEPLAQGARSLTASGIT